MKTRRFACGALAVIMLAGCAPKAASNLSTGIPQSAMVNDQLKFGRGIPGGGTVSDSAWAVFLAEVVTPRFPQGFGVTRGEGQWRYADGTIGKEESFTLEVTHPLGEPPDSTIENIAQEYNRRFKQDAVFHVRTPVQAWLIMSPKK